MFLLQRGHTVLVQKTRVLLLLSGLFFIFVPICAFAEVTDLDQDDVPDSEDQEVIVSSNQSLASGEYFFYNLTIASSSVLTLVGDPNASGEFKGVKINAENITIESGSAVSANGTGYTTLEESPGRGDYNGGYGYGGEGGDWSYRESSAFGGDSYGSAFEPKDLGSGGEPKAAGGGAIWLAVSGVLKNNGTISANGARQQASGGSIYVRTGLLEGSGIFTSNGAGCASYFPYSGAGSGGRIAIYYGGSGFTGSVEVLRGGAGFGDSCQGERAGQDGTVVFVDTTNNDLYLYDRLLFQTNESPYEFNRIILSDSAAVSSGSDVSITAHTVILDEESSFDTAGIHSFTTDNLMIDDGSTFISAEGQSLAISSLSIRNRGVAQFGRGEVFGVFDSITLENESTITTAPLHILHLEARDITIDETSAISVTGAGYSPRSGPGFNDSGAGASYGGLGESGIPSPVYGSETEPVDFGSGGSSDAYGGGSLRIIVSGTLENNGSVSADATPMKNGASGGSVYVTTNKLSGSGSFTALGGNTRGYIADVGAGGGGRIAVFYNESDFVGTTTAKGGDRYVGGSSMQTYYAQDGTVVFEKEEPKVSSVLFIPGIMGSRLFEMSDVCDTEVNEQERWLSRDECDHMQMMMRIDGVSKNNIYVKAGKGGLIDEVYTFNLYKTFVDTLKEWKDAEFIADYAVLPYDWRLGLDSILKTKEGSEGHVVYDVTTPYAESYLYQTVKELAENQYGGKVTIVTHSNGGLLAKAFLRTLEVNNDPLLLSIDTVVMVAAPQAGTPDALVGMLHGTEIQPIISQETTRQLTANMPFAYHLLPNSNYFSGESVTVKTPVITFEEGSETATWMSKYGAEIKSKDDMQSFLRKESGRVVPAIDDLLTPAVVDGYLFNYANMIEILLGEWEVPSHIKLYQVAGTGIDTPSGITYFTDKECVSRNPLKLFQCTEYKPKLGYRPNMVIDGDGTVVVPSALAMSDSDENVERWWVNLREYNKDGFLGFENINRVHKDIFEVNDVINFIQNTIQASTTATYEYLGEIAPQLSSDNRLVFYLHSPLDMFITTPDGIVSSTTNTIRGGTYRRYGELQYISLPRGSGENYTLMLNGLAEGSFTLEIEEWGGDEMENRHIYSGIPSSADTMVRMEIEGTVPVSEAVLEVDYDGNGTKDIIYNTSGEVVASVTYGTLKEAIQPLSLKPAFKKVLLATVKVAELHHQKSLTKHTHAKLEVRTLQLLKQQIVLYVRLRLISQTEGQNVIAIIESLIRK